MVSFEIFIFDPGLTLQKTIIRHFLQAKTVIVLCFQEKPGKFFDNSIFWFLPLILSSAFAIQIASCELDFTLTVRFVGPIFFAFKIGSFLTFIRFHIDLNPLKQNAQPISGIWIVCNDIFRVRNRI